MFSGSRLEVSSTVLIASRAREDVVLVYTPFFWGSWNKLFYPFTLKPIEPITILHPDVETMIKILPNTNFNILMQEKNKEFLNIQNKLSRLRKLTAYNQLKLNTNYAISSVVYPLDMHYSGINFSFYIKNIKKYL